MARIIKCPRCGIKVEIREEASTKEFLDICLRCGERIKEPLVKPIKK